MFHMHNSGRHAHHGAHKAFHLAGKLGRRSGLAKFMGGFSDSEGRDGSGFRMGRKLAGQDLQLLVLALLAEKPSHGYELIKTLEERSGGFYVPSPGMIYPALTYLEEIGHAAVEVEGAKKLYRPTVEGLAQLDRRRAEAEAIFAQLTRIGQRMGDVRRAFAGQEDDDGDTSELRQARRALRQTMHSKRRAPAEEQKRVAEILRRAVAEIEGKAS